MPRNSPEEKFCL